MSYKIGYGDSPGLLHEQMEILREKNDDWWYSGMLDRTMCGRMLSRREQDEVMQGSTDAALRTFHTVASRFENLAPDSIANLIGLHVEYAKKDELWGNENILALYDPKISTITLCEENVSAVQHFISEQNLNDILETRDILNIALAHEIFHALEDRTPGIYTRQRMLRRKFLLFPVNVGLDAASEIGAVHFSKLMGRLPFSPCIYELLLLVRNGRMIPDVWRV